MRSQRFIPRRYQLKKEGVQVVLSGHPWVFRTHLSTAADGFREGQWLRLVDSANAPIGYGICESAGLIGIRVFKRGKNEPTRDWLLKQLDKALAKREDTRKYTDAFRAVHGESDGFPGVVIDIYGPVVVLQTYSPSVDSLGRYLASVIAKRFELQHVLWKLPTKRRKTSDSEASVRWLRGGISTPIRFREGKMQLTVEPQTGQKSGAFLDLRALRKWTNAQDLRGKKVLNLFSYTGTLALAAENAGATEIWSVDIAPKALETAKAFHTIDASKHRFIQADIFDWLKNLPAGEKFDLIICDPPMMASATTQVRKALDTYQRMYESLAPHVNKGGQLVAACCTSRIARKRFTDLVAKTVAPKGFKLKTSLLPEADHPTGFSEADYLKILVFSR